MEQKKIHRWRENFRWNKHAPFLASWIGLGQAQGGGDKMYKKKLRQIEASLWGHQPSCLEAVLSFVCQIELWAGGTVTLVCHFKSLLQWDRTEEITHSPDISYIGAALLAQMVKNTPAMQETRVPSLGQKDPLEKEIAMHSSILTWRISRTEEPGNRVAKSQTRLSDSLLHIIHIYIYLYVCVFNNMWMEILKKFWSELPHAVFLFCWPSRVTLKTLY